MSYKMNIDQASEKSGVEISGVEISGVEKSGAEKSGVEKSVVDQPVIIQPDSSAAVVTPAAVHVPIQTGCCECSDGPWWGYCCFGLWFHSCAGFFMNLKLDKNLR